MGARNFVCVEVVVQHGDGGSERASNDLIKYGSTAAPLLLVEGGDRTFESAIESKTKN